MTTSTPTIRIAKDSEWERGTVKTWAQRALITVDAGAHGRCQLVFDVDRRGAMLMGVQRERLVGDAFGDGYIAERLPAAAVPNATWRRIYRADARRRAHYA